MANRLSRVIHTLISQDQTCCIPRRDIADNVLLMNNIISYLNKNDSNGYILKIDQYKAFDRVEHDYLFDVLEKMGFGTKFRKWIKIIYNDIVACIKHNGYIYDTFNIKRGVRQGCPVSAILYVLCAEPLHDAIVNCNNISGIKFLDYEAKIFQHTDDITFFLDNVSCIANVFSVLNTYEKASGSMCNMNKTELLVIGTRLDSMIYDFNFPVRYDFIEILGIFLGNNQMQIEKENWEKRINVCSKVLNLWSNRKLSFKGKALVVNSLVLSRLIYSVTVLPVPNWVIDIVKDNIVKFIWSDKRPLIA